MVRRALQEDQRLILLVTLTALLIIVICGTTCFTTVASAVVTTELKTYTDPAGFFTLQYPADWTVEYKQPATKFDEPRVVFKAYHLMSIFTENSIDSIVTIYVSPSKANNPQEFRDVVSSLSSYLENHNRAITIMGKGFGRYSIAGYDTYAIAYRNAEDPTNPLSFLTLISRIGTQEMTIVYSDDQKSFEKQMPVVQKMIESIKITGVR
jgi:PsbP-like protein